MPAQNPDIALQKRLEQRVRGFMLRRELWPDEGPMLVAVSGGPDSTALLLLLARLARYRGVHLHAAYFDHAIRGPKASEIEADFVSGLAGSLGLSFSTGRGDVAGRARRDRTSSEDAARRERYDFLACEARAIGAKGVATGHTASDQAETVLLHIVRGAGLEGLAGMAPSSAWPVPGGEGLSLIRPLLPLNREETRAYCAAAGLEPLTDESNAAPDYTRNRVRNELLPLLRSFNPKIEGALVRLADAARAENAGIRHALVAASGGARDFEAGHVDAIERLLHAGTTGDSIALPRRLRATRTRDAVRIGVPPAERPLPDGAAALRSGTAVVFGDLMVAVQDRAPEAGVVAVEVDAGAAMRGLVVRRRRNGDRIQPAGMEGTRKLQDLFVDAHIDRVERDRVPIFESERGIVWVGGLRIAEWAKPRPGEPTVWFSYRKAS